MMWGEGPEEVVLTSLAKKYLSVDRTLHGSPMVGGVFISLFGDGS
jgi:hypothetical protein